MYLELNNTKEKENNITIKNIMPFLLKKHFLYKNKAIKKDKKTPLLKENIKTKKKVNLYRKCFLYINEYSKGKIIREEI